MTQRPQPSPKSYAGRGGYLGMPQYIKGINESYMLHEGVGSLAVGTNILEQRGFTHDLCLVKSPFCPTMHPVDRALNPWPSEATGPVMSAGGPFYRKINGWESFPVLKSSLFRCRGGSTASGTGRSRHVLCGVARACRPGSRLAPAPWACLATTHRGSGRQAGRYPPIICRSPGRRALVAPGANS